MARGIIEEFAGRVAGFELQMGPYAVAELRTTDLLRKYEANSPPNGMRTYVTNTLDDPYADIAELGSAFRVISASRRRANEVKARTPVTVVIGNPPYRERAEGSGGWVESGQESTRHSKQNPWVPLDDFKAPSASAHSHNLKNLYVYFWRWATWKVFDAHEDDSSGVVCFITLNGFLRGPGFTGMREYLRRTASEGWIINVTPEGHRPDVPTRLFPGVQQPIAIALFVRQPDADPSVPATIRYTELHGHRNEKREALASLDLDSSNWREVRTSWQAPLTPAADSNWDDYPALSDIFPWTSPGVTGNRGWPYAPSREVLRQRWRTLIAEDDQETKENFFKETRDRKTSSVKPPLPGSDTTDSSIPVDDEKSDKDVTPIRVGYRSFDRQWLIPDNRILDMPRRDLWASRMAGQVFVVEQHSHEISDGPGLVFTSLLPDLHHFNNRGGRALPLFHPDGSANLAPKFKEALAEILDLNQIESEDVIAYVAAVVAHPDFTTRFSDELTTPGIRIPITLDADLWQEAVTLGRQIVWLHTYGEIFDDTTAGRPKGKVKAGLDENRIPKELVAVSAMPNTLHYTEERRTLHLGEGVWGPVEPGVWEYSVGGKNVIRSWFNYRKSTPGGKKTSPLDNINQESWPHEWTIELIELLAVLTQLVDLETHQSDLLDRILMGKVARSQYLRDIGIRWPAQKKDRKVRYPRTLSRDSREDDQGGQQTFL
ncbi:type ISP restriction/modification enzyme [Actinopolyspora sp. H202]|uniref:type ISP restriction/modification enzyme n=1 Tax=Actinopolyspora sp. H202 TaxID=1500456 RepID=UPI003EE62E88